MAEQITQHVDDAQLRIGKNFRGLLNDLKRRPEDAAKDLDVSLADVEAIIAGKKELSPEIVAKAVQKWPINSRDFYLLHDDSPHGVKVMRAEESAKRARVMDRAGNPYYEYRDTATSSVSLFRPEWIKELCVVDDNDVDNPAVQWNNGHFMHQFTYFIGPVNFYYKGLDGEKKVAVMNTGDSMYITPFVAHTFTTRKNDEGKEGLILALTYGNKVAAETQQELSAVGKNLASNYVLDFTSKEKAYASLLTFHREAASVTVEELSRRTSIDKTSLEAYVNGENIPDYHTLLTIAKALSVNLRDLLPLDYIPNTAKVQKYEDCPRWLYPADTQAYELVELTCTNSLPHSKALEFNIKNQNTEDKTLDLRCGLHQYGYNVSDKPTKLNWKLDADEYSETINPGDSFCVKPFVQHNFRGDGKLLILRIGGRAVGDAQIELSALGPIGAQRALGETTQWYNPEGKSS